MRTALRPIFVGLMILGLTSSCQKEISIDNSATVGPANDLMGNWSYLSIRVKAVTSSEMENGGDSYLVVTNSDYTSTNNKGTCFIDGTEFRVNNVSYDVDTQVQTEQYINGVSVTKLELPFSFTLPPSSSVSKYRKVGADSLYFYEGGFMQIDGNTTVTEPSGGRYRLEGNKLYLDGVINRTEVETIQGVTETKKTQANVTYTLQRL